MTEPDTLGIWLAALLGTGSEAHPADAENNARLNSLRRAMNAARALSDAFGEPDHDDHPAKRGLLPPDWASLQEAAGAAIGREEKRMDAAALLLEAMFRAQGLPGLTAGAGFIASLIDQHWDRLEPRPQISDPMAPPGPRQIAAALLDPLKPIANDQLPGILRQTVLFTLTSGIAYTLLDCERAKRRPAMEARLASEKKGPLDPRRAATIVRLEMELASAALRGWDNVAEEARTTQGEAIGKLCDAIKDAQTAWSELEGRLAAREAAGIVPLSPVRDLLATLLALLMPLAAPAPHAVPGAAALLPTGLAAPGRDQTPVATRDQALAALSDIARFFHRTEPQSPVSTAIEEVVRRASLTWPDLIAEMIPKQDERDGVLLRLGIRPRPPGQ